MHDYSYIHFRGLTREHIEAFCTSLQRTPIPRYYPEAREDWTREVITWSLSRLGFPRHEAERIARTGKGKPVQRMQAALKVPA